MSDPSVTGPRTGHRRPRPLLRTTLGDVLRRTRREQRRTLADVARAAKVSMPYLSEIERGRKEASSEVLGAICDALRIELSDLLAQAGQDLVDRRAPVVRENVVRENVVRLDLVRLEAIRGRRGPSQPHGSGDAQCLLAA
jgi:transcriptional regulator with XRE-family HTH domain